MQQPWQSLPELNEPSRRHHCHARLAPGATASVIVPWYLERYAETDDSRPLGWWIADNVEHFAEAIFFPWLCSFNIRWYEGPSDKAIKYDSPEQREDIVLTRRGMDGFDRDHSDQYPGFPAAG